MNKLIVLRNLYIVVILFIILNINSVTKCEIPSRASTPSSTTSYQNPNSNSSPNPSTYQSLNSPPSKYNTYPYPASPYSPNYKSTYIPISPKDSTTSSPSPSTPSPSYPTPSPSPPTSSAYSSSTTTTNTNENTNTESIPSTTTFSDHQNSNSLKNSQNNIESSPNKPSIHDNNQQTSPAILKPDPSPSPSPSQFPPQTESEIPISDTNHQYPPHPDKILKNPATYNPNGAPVPNPSSFYKFTPTPIDKVKNNEPPSNFPTAFPSHPTPYPAPPFQNSKYTYNPNTEFSSFDKQQSLDNPYNMYSNDLACKKATFITIPLGTTGGLDESNLSSFLLTKKGSNVFIALDAGTLWTGIGRFISNRNYNNLINITFPVWATQIDQQVAWFIRNHILGYFIGHSHLDHINGLIEASPEDYLPPSALEIQPPIEGGLLGMVKAILDPTVTIGNTPNVLKKKAIVGLPFTVNAIKTNLFNNVIWPNLPGFGRYDYYSLDIAQTYDLSQLVFLNDSQKQTLNGFFPTNMDMIPFETCHNDILSTSFLFTDKATGEQIVFFSDTGVPSGNYNCDWQQRIYNVWRKIKIDKLKAIYLECSFTNNATDASLFGHLRPKDIHPLLTQLVDMSQQTIPKTSNLSHVKLIIQHIKPMVNQNTSNRLTIRQIIYKELTDHNPTGVNIIIPQQGELICI